MIVNLKDQKRFNLFTKLIEIFVRLRFEFSRFRMMKKLFKDSQELQALFKQKYPHLKKDLEGNTLCVSCHLCTDICPSNSIEVKKSNMMNFPDSILEGEAPLHFYLDVESCTKCNQCSVVCALDAIELTGEYKAKKVDLALDEIPTEE